MEAALKSRRDQVAGDFDGFVFGNPVHWGGAGGGSALPEQETVSFTNFIH